MKAIVTKAFSGVPDGKVYPQDFAIGDEVEGALATEAVNAGWAKPERKAHSAAPENKESLLSRAAKMFGFSED